MQIIGHLKTDKKENKKKKTSCYHADGQRERERIRKKKTKPNTQQRLKDIKEKTQRHIHTHVSTRRR